MAKLFYSPQLSLSLEEAVENQRNGQENGKDHHLGSVVLTTKKLYDEIFKVIGEMEEVKKILKKLTSKSISSCWREKFPKVTVMLPHDTIKIVPCIKTIKGDTITIALPIYLGGATGEQVEKVLSSFVEGNFICVVYNEILITIKIPTRATYTLDT